MAKSKIQVLEALLRLRQAACHPGLIDRERADASSSKLEVLVPRIAESVAEGHKALVFSQFTSLLAIVRADEGPHCESSPGGPGAVARLTVGAHVGMSSGPRPRQIAHSSPGGASSSAASSSSSDSGFKIASRMICRAQVEGSRNSAAAAR
ncbi:MAG: hypothetical protein ACREON_00265 [Gemmatimonadaceae bacterium]